MNVPMSKMRLEPDKTQTMNFKIKLKFVHIWFYPGDVFLGMDKTDYADKENMAPQQQQQQILQQQQQEAEMMRQEQERLLQQQQEQFRIQQEEQLRIQQQQAMVT